MAIDDAIVRRCIELSGDDMARDRIVSGAVKEANSENSRLQGELDAISHRLGRVRVEIDNLVAVLKNMGASGIESVAEELTTLEAKRHRLRDEAERLKSLAATQSGIGAVGRQFLDSWRNVGQLIQHAKPDERRKLIRHLVEVVEWTTTSSDGRQGTYKLVLFPEVVRNRSEMTVVRPEPAITPALHPKNGQVLSPVLQEVEKAPRNQPCS